MPSLSLAYLDHNVLDLMSKGDLDGIVQLLTEASLTPVFSHENLEEIRRSSGYEQTYLELLERIDARHLVPLLDEHSKHSGKAEVRQINPFDAYKSYVENSDPLPELGFGLTGMLQKFYGGRQNQTYEEILSGGADELKQLFSQIFEDLKDSPELDDVARLVLLATTVAPKAVMDQYRAVAAHLDGADADVALKQFEETMALGPKILNNIQRPDLLQKIWAHVKNKLPSDELDFEIFFGIKFNRYEKNADREKTLLEKVNAIYHQLNFLGYYRDSQMHKQWRFAASFSDMTHAGVASFCNVLISRDKNLSMKAAAAYEYLGVNTRILHYGANKGIEPTR